MKYFILLLLLSLIQIISAQNPCDEYGNCMNEEPNDNIDNIDNVPAQNNDNNDDNSEWEYKYIVTTFQHYQKLAITVWSFIAIFVFISICIAYQCNARQKYKGYSRKGIYTDTEFDYSDTDCTQNV